MTAVPLPTSMTLFVTQLKQESTTAMAVACTAADEAPTPTTPSAAMTERLAQILCNLDIFTFK